jgi:plasmid stabilization system protein ParE
VPRSLGYTGKALADLAGIRLWLTQAGSGPAARQRLTSIRTSINRLRKHPCMFAVGHLPGVRELPCAGGYRALYQVTPDTGRNDTAGNVFVLRIYGPGQVRGQK